MKSLLFLWALLLGATLSGCSSQRAAPNSGQIVEPSPRTANEALKSYPAAQRQQLLDAGRAYTEHVQSRLPSGTRVYALHMFHLYDPTGHANVDFPVGSLVTRSSTSVIITPPHQAPQFFSADSVVTQDPNSIMYIYVQPGQTPSTLVKEHATLDHIIK